VDSNEYPQTTPDDELVLELTHNPEPLDPEPLDPEPRGGTAQDYQWYEPGLFARLTQNRALIVLLIIAFLVLVIGPSLFYILNPPRPRPPIPVRGQGFPAFNTPLPEKRTNS
jgi:hypothetical protein